MRESLRITAALAALLFPLGPSVAAFAAEHCPIESPGGVGLRFSHVPIAVADLDAATTRYRDELGFTIKPGHPHGNGIRNAHIRLRDGSALELITATEARDPLSAWYGEFLARGEGGAFLAFDAGPIYQVEHALIGEGFTLDLQVGGAFDVGSFPAGDSLRPFFFVEVHRRTADRPEQLEHENGAARLCAVWVAVDDAERAQHLLIQLGLTPGETREYRDGIVGRAMRWPGGTVFLVDSFDLERKRAGVLAVEIASDRAEPGLIAPTEAHGLWIELVPAQQR